jgi:hyperosmotically inducible protein
MKATRFSLIVLILAALGTMAGCWGNSGKSPEVSSEIRKALDQAGLKSVSVSQDRDKGVVTLGGQVSSDNEKAQAESLAKSLAGAQVVADEVAVVPVGGASDAKAMNSDLDQGIEKNLDAALIQNKMHDDVKYAVKNGVITLNGDVSSDDTRALAEKIAGAVPNVLQVVNDLQVKNRKASSSL